MSIVEIKIPSPGESITEVEIGSWLKADGDYVMLDETICEIETDKATLPLIAQSSGVLTIILPEGEVAGIGDVACSIDTNTAQIQNSTPDDQSIPSETLNNEVSNLKSDSYSVGHPSPTARKIIAERAIMHTPIHQITCKKNMSGGYFPDHKNAISVTSRMIRKTPRFRRNFDVSVFECFCIYNQAERPVSQIKTGAQIELTNLV